MDIVKLIIIFVVIVIVMRLNKPIHISVSVGALATILLYRIELIDIFNLIKIGTLGESTISLVLAFYTITFLQRMRSEERRVGKECKKYILKRQKCKNEK